MRLDHSSENPSKTYFYHENPYENCRRSLVGEIKNSIIITGDRLGRVQFSSITNTNSSQSDCNQENLKCNKQVQLTDEPIVAIEAKEVVAMQSKKVFLAVASKMKFSIYEIITENNQINLKNIQTALFDSEITSLASVSKKMQVFQLTGNYTMYGEHQFNLFRNGTIWKRNSLWHIKVDQFLESNFMQQTTEELSFQLIFPES